MNQNSGLHRLNIDLVELLTAMEDTFFDHHYYLDIESGQIVLVADETRSQLEEIYEDAPKSQSGQEDWDLDSLLESSGLPDWEKQTLREANDVENNFGDRYITIPRNTSDEAYRDMQDFAASVALPKLKDRLNAALEQKHPFRRFKDVLLNYPAEEQQWYEFSENRVLERVLEWLRDEKIEPVFQVKEDTR